MQGQESLERQFSFNLKIYNFTVTAVINEKRKELNFIMSVILN